jgi:hypothetical protein
MAKYNEILTGRYNRFIQKLFSMKGSAPAPQLSGDIQMSHSFFHGAENRFLETWNRYGMGIFNAAIVGQVSVVRIRNPLKSGAILVLEKVTISIIAAVVTEVDYGVSPPTSVDQNVVAATFPVDARQPGASSSVAIVSLNNAAPILMPTIIGRPVLNGNNYEVIVTDDQEIALAPGGAFQAQSTVANQALLVGFLWRERGLEESELS